MSHLKSKANSGFCNRIVLLAGIIGIQACASYKTQYAKDIQTQSPELENIVHRIYAIGDAGFVHDNSLSPALELLGERLRKDNGNSTLLFLGDNIYPKGLAGKSHKEERKDGEAALMQQLNLLENYKGTAYFIPGNHDWGKGLDAVRRQGKFINKYINQELNGIEDKHEYKTYFYPENGCSGPDVIELSDNLVIVLVDSQWWFADWDTEPTINSGCPIKSRKDFAFQLEEVLRKHRFKNVIIASHHGIDSYGPHGGQYTAKTHLFPLTELNPNLWIPFPGIGSLSALIRSGFGINQDVSNGTYKSWIETLVDKSAAENGDFIFLSGHEHSLQYLEYKNQKQIISGSGSKHEGTRQTGNALFTSSEYGFTELQIDAKGQVRVVYWSANQPDKPLFSKTIKGPLKKLEAPKQNFEEYPIKAKTKVTTSVEYDLKETTPLYDKLLGTHYRSIYGEKYEFPILDLDTAYGGMQIIKRGGGNQTNSLRLKDAKGREWALRSLTKDAERLLPYPFNKVSLAEDIVIENFLSTHVFAALSVPALADAANIYHTNPKLYYVPKQPALDIYNSSFGGEVYLLEERPDDSWAESASFGYPIDVEGTPDVVEELTEDHKKYIDQNWAARSRLFDLMIGDWDRHDDQWRWVELKDEEGRKFYRPVPRDRDQVFSKYDGMVAKVASMFPSGFLHQLKPYSDEIPDVRWAGWSARYFDRSFVNELEWKDWKMEAEFLKANVTDEIIDKAFENWPQKARELSEDEIKGHLKARRDGIVKTARQLYLVLAKEVDVLGTDAKDRFDLVYENDTTLKIQVWDTNKKGEKERLLKQRSFNLNHTKQIHIYAMDDDDWFVVSGNPSNKVKVRLVGGLGEDRFIADESIKSSKARLLAYDEKDGDDIIEKKYYRDKRSKKNNQNIYDRRAYHYEYDLFSTMPVISYNGDNGLILGLNAQWTKYTFKKSPYGQLHSLEGTYAFKSNSPRFEYKGTFIETFGRWDVLLNAVWSQNRNSLNYFGMGNQSKFDEDISFYRVQLALVDFNPALQKRMAGDKVIFTIGPSATFISINDDNTGLLASDISDQNLTVFDPFYLAGFRTGITFDGRDNFLYPKKGSRLGLNVEWTENMDNRKNALMFDARFSTVFSFGAQKKVQLATELAYGAVEGDYEFFQAPFIGQNNGLRGYRFGRFRGDQTYYQTTDLRLQLFNTKKAIPFTGGLFSGFDYGRVWLNSETSNQWHLSYGGGIWIAPVNYVALNTSIFFSREGARFFVDYRYSF